MTIHFSYCENGFISLYLNYSNTLKCIYLIQKDLNLPYHYNNSEIHVSIIWKWFTIIFHKKHLSQFRHFYKRTCGNISEERIQRNCEYKWLFFLISIIPNSHTKYQHSFKKKITKKKIETSLTHFLDPWNAL